MAFTRTHGCYYILAQPHYYDLLTRTRAYSRQRARGVPLHGRYRRYSPYQYNILTPTGAWINILIRLLCIPPLVGIFLPGARILHFACTTHGFLCRFATTVVPDLTLVVV